MDTSGSYRVGAARWWQLFSDAQVGVAVACVVVGVWIQSPVPVAGVCVVVLMVPGWRRVALVGLVGGSIGAALAVAAWRDVVPDRLGPFRGWACLVTDPAPRNGATVAVFEIEGERFETWARGSPRRRLEPHLAGECARIDAERTVLTGVNERRAAIRHVVGGVRLESVGDWSEGSPANRSSNRIRRLFAVGAGRLEPPDDALFAGLVIGDDRLEPTAMIDQFRDSGLSHLTAVSGSNVAFVLSAASPLLRRLRPGVRWVATIGVIAWFVALTRFEPSILRAGLMAAIASTGFLLGRERPPARVLALAVGILVLVDPLLVWSVGFWLSVAATAGVALLSGPLAGVVPGPRWLAMPLGVTLGAQIAVAPVSLMVFGTLPIVSVPANLIAVPVAGLVMLYGLPAGLLSGALSGSRLLGGFAHPLADLVQLPSALGTRWVARVAAIASRIEPAPPWPVIGWCAVVGFCVIRILSRAWWRRR